MKALRKWLGRIVILQPRGETPVQVKITDVEGDSQVWFWAVLA